MCSACEKKYVLEETAKMNDQEKQLIEEGRNQVLYLLLCLGDENVAHDHWNPYEAEVLVKARQEIVKRLKIPTPGGVCNTVWPHLKEDRTRDWPNFETYTYTPG
ncbi:hypothetical protein ES703_123636 [subsurface metagenome]